MNRKDENNHIDVSDTEDYEVAEVNDTSPGNLVTRINSVGEDRINLSQGEENRNSYLQEKLRKLDFLIEESKKIKIDMEFLKKNLRLLQHKHKGLKDRHFDNLLELQCFQADYEHIWVAKISYDGRYLATGGKSGVLKVWEIYNEEESLDNYEFKGILSYLRLINESAYKTYREHTNDIIDLCWSEKNINIILTASLDHSVIMWDIRQDTSVQKFVHSAMVSSVSFDSTSDEDLFVTGCFDKIVRIWSPKNKVVDYINVQEYITAVSFFPTGDNIAVGNHLGRCSIYECKPKLKYSYSFDCKNKSGKYSDGRKITSIAFVNKNQMLITTNDSRIRLININDGKTIQKYKGLINDEYMIRANFEEIYDLVISASDDSFVYVWKKLSSTSGHKNNAYEFYKCFNEKENATCSLFLHDRSLDEYNKKIKQVSNSIHTRSIMINTSSTGKIQVVLNLEMLNINLI